MQDKCKWSNTRLSSYKDLRTPCKNSAGSWRFKAHRLWVIVQENQSTEIKKVAYSFSVAVVTNSHKLGILKQHECIISQLWMAEVQNQGVNRVALSKGSQGGSMPCLFQLLVALEVHWLRTTSLWSLLSTFTLPLLLSQNSASILSR